MVGDEKSQGELLLAHFEEDGIDDIMLEHSFPQMPDVVAEVISSHISFIRKFVYYEGRIGLLKRAKSAGIPLVGCNLSSLNFESLAKEHKELRSLINTKHESRIDTCSVCLYFLCSLLCSHTNDLHPWEMLARLNELGG